MFSCAALHVALPESVSFAPCHCSSLNLLRLPNWLFLWYVSQKTELFQKWIKERYPTLTDEMWDAILEEDRYTDSLYWIFEPVDIFAYGEVYKNKPVQEYIIFMLYS